MPWAGQLLNGITGELFFKQKFAGALRSFHYGLDEGNAQLPFFQFKDAVNGASGGSSHGVLQERGVVAGFQHHACGTFHGLGGEQSGDIAGKTDLDARFGERFKDDVGKGWPAGGETGDRVHVFFVDNDRAADGAEHGFCDIQMFCRSMGAATDAGHTAAHGGASVGHGSHDGDFCARSLLDIAGRHGGGHRNNQSTPAESRFDFLHDLANHLRLHGEKNDVGSLDGGSVVRRYVNAEFAGQRSGLFVVTNGCGDAFGGEQALLEVSAEQDGAEFAGAKNREILVREFSSHSDIIVTEEERVVNKRFMMSSDRMRAMTKRVRFAAVLGIATVGVGLAWLGAPVTGAAESREGETRRKDVAVRMRDGVILRADVWLPKAEGRFPVLLYRTPYGKQNAPKDWTTFEKAVKRGYAVVIQDVRGRYASDGEFTPYQNEGNDGYDTIEWVAQQPWSDGNVGTFGLSYPGAVQWLAAVENPPHLNAMVPAMTFSTPRNFFYSGGLFDGSWLEWIWMNIAPDARKRKNLPGPATDEEAAAIWKREHARIEGFLPLRDLPDLKQAAPYYYEWLEHPPADPWWDWAELRNKYDRVRCAVLNFSGWYDEAYGPDGATTNLNGLLAARRGEVDPRTRTVIGPWTHGGQNTQKSGERDFGPSAPIDYDEMILRWMDRYLRNVNNGVEREKPVRIFVMGKNEWRNEEAWPLKRAKAQTLYLGANEGNARIGLLAPQAGISKVAASTLISDPAHPVSDTYEQYGAHDYRALAGRDDVLVFDSAPMKEDLEVTGPIQAQLYASADVRDFDLWVRLLDVAPDGAAFNLMSPGLDVLRASYREETREPKLVEPSKIYRLDLNRMLTSNVFLKGHRIRVQISGAFYPHFSRNLQTGESEIVSAESTTGRLSIHHDTEHPSRIVLPVITQSVLQLSRGAHRGGLPPHGEVDAR